MLNRIFSEALRSAEIPEQDFEAALHKAGFKNCVDWFLRGAPPSLVDAYNERVVAEGGAK